MKNIINTLYSSLGQEEVIMKVIDYEKGTKGTL